MLLLMKAINPQMHFVDAHDANEGHIMDWPYPLIDNDAADFITNAACCCNRWRTAKRTV